MTDNDVKLPCRFVKVGGSLFANDRLVESFRAWLDAHDDLPNIVICGGGQLVDALRYWSREHRINDEVAHWSAIRMMDESTRLLASRFPELPCVAPLTLPAIIPDGSEFWLISELIKRHSQLPHDWTVTSDSLSAELAQLQGTSELFLLKSGLPDSPVILDWVASGFVDRCFFKSSRSFAKVTLVDLITGRSLIATK